LIQDQAEITAGINHTTTDARIQTSWQVLRESWVVPLVLTRSRLD